MKNRSNQSAQIQVKRSGELPQTVQKRIFLVLISLLLAMLVSGAPAHAETLNSVRTETANLTQVDEAETIDEVTEVSASMAESAEVGHAASDIEKNSTLSLSTDIKPVFIGQPFGRSSSMLLAFEEPYGDSSKSHTGIDIAGTLGEQVLAGVSGTVSYVGRTVGSVSSDVNCITITDNIGNKITYRPLDPSVKVGDLVDQGQVIGSLFENGDPSSAATHLNMSVRDEGGNYVDPWPLLVPFSLPLEDHAEETASVPIQEPSISDVMLKTQPETAMLEPVMSSVAIEDAQVPVSSAPDPVVATTTHQSASTPSRQMVEQTINQMVLKQQITADLKAESLQEPIKVADTGISASMPDKAQVQKNAEVVTHAFTEIQDLPVQVKPASQNYVAPSTGQIALRPAPLQAIDPIRDYASSTNSTDLGSVVVAMDGLSKTNTKDAQKNLIDAGSSNFGISGALNNGAFVLFSLALFAAFIRHSRTLLSAAKSRFERIRDLNLWMDPVTARS